MKHYKKNLDTVNFTAKAEYTGDGVYISVKGKRDSITCQHGVLTQLYRCCEAFYPEYVSTIQGTNHCGISASCTLILNKESKICTSN
jgi:hypothetical protein